jgi:hypothetical protein
MGKVKITSKDKTGGMITSKTAEITIKETLKGILKVIKVIRIRKALVIKVKEEITRVATNRMAIINVETIEEAILKITILIRDNIIIMTSIKEQKRRKETYFPPFLGGRNDSKRMYI